MAKIKPERAYAKEIFDGFGGIGANSGFGGKGAADMRNFRVLSDGSLQKRCGWVSPIYSAENARGYWRGSINGREFCFMVSGQTICRVYNEMEISVGTTTSTEGRIRFFSYGGNLFLLDGAELRVFDPVADWFVTAHGYAPLFGRKWHPTSHGEVNEPINIFSRRLRIHYSNTTGTKTFTLPFSASSLDQVRVDRQLVYDYQLSEDKLSFTITQSGTSIEIAYTMAMSMSEREEILQCALAFCDRTEAREKLLLYASPQKNLLFCAANVTQSMLDSSTAAYRDSDSLYFTYNTMLTLGDTNHPITSVCRNGDRYLAFHRDGAWSIAISDEANTVHAYPLLHGIGCHANDAIIYLEGDPVIINAAGIFRIHSPTSDPDAFQLTCLSTEISDLITPTFAANAITVEDLAHAELWFCDPLAPGAPIYVYQTLQKTWYCFDGINPLFFFRDEMRIGFGSGRKICFFDEDCNSDGGVAIHAYYTSQDLTFGSPESQKRTLRISLCVENGQNPTHVLLQTEKAERELNFYSPKTSHVSYALDRRAAMGRFRILRLTLKDSGVLRPRYYRLALFANL